jgi:iron complex outermembrane receptor protein
MVSAELGWTTANEKVRYTLFVNNLTNAKVAQQISSAALGSYIIYERPRRVGVGMDVNF